MNILEQNKNQTTEEFYESLKEKLADTHDFPEDYQFKFIIPNDPSKITEIYRIFDGIKYTLNNRDSKNGKYTAINVNAFVLDADHVVKIYQEAAKVDGIISL